MIDEEINHAKAGEPAYIGIKVNSISDKKIMLKLVEASQQGVKVDLIVRGICCLIAGVKGYTENITIRSIVGRYLEHSRIYMFGTHDRMKIYISSADYMTRNTTKRVEVAVPIYDTDVKERLYNMFNIMLKDNVQARIQLPDGTYKRIKNKEEPISSQLYFYQQAYDNAKRVKEENQNPYLTNSLNTKEVSDSNDSLFFNMYLKN